MQQIVYGDVSVTPPVGSPPVATHRPPAATAPAHVALYAPNAKHPASGSIVISVIVHAESLYATIPLLVHVAPEGASQPHEVQPRPSSCCAK